MSILAASILFAFQTAKLPLSEVPTSLVPAIPAKETPLINVNGTIIKAGDVDALLWDWRKEDVLNDLVSFRVIKDAASRQSLSATDKEIEDAKNQLMEALRGTLQPGQTIEQVMLQEGTTDSRIYLRVHTEVLLRKLILQKFNKNDFVDISTIVIRHKPDDAADIKRAMEAADSGYKELMAGRPWEEVLKKFAGDERAIAAKGKVGWRFLSAFPDQARNEIVVSKTGSYTKPAATTNGYQIFRIDAKGIDVGGDALGSLQDWYVNAMRQPTVDALRREAKITRLDKKVGG